MAPNSGPCGRGFGGNGKGFQSCLLRACQPEVRARAGPHPPGIHAPRLAPMKTVGTSRNRVCRQVFASWPEIRNKQDAVVAVCNQLLSISASLARVMDTSEKVTIPAGGYGDSGVCCRGRRGSGESLVWGGPGRASAALGCTRSDRWSVPPGLPQGETRGRPPCCPLPGFASFCPPTALPCHRAGRQTVNKQMRKCGW